MIELRWLESGDGHEDDPVTLKLQYRQWLPEEDEMYRSNPNWVDVPVVRAK